MKKKFHIVFGLLFFLKSLGQTTDENYLLKNIGYISIPSNMEIQSGNY